MTETLRYPFKYRDDRDRILSNVVVTDSGCWEWQLSRDPQGYGRVGVRIRGEGQNRRVAAHRLAYEALVGAIPDGLQIDHLCRNPPCCNPAHLEAVEMFENIRRSPLSNVSKTHCKQGHAFDERNTHYEPSGKRSCRACSAAAQRRRYWAKREAKA